jgi:hypothetical protein
MVEAAFRRRDTVARAMKALVAVRLVITEAREK